ncbi:hypothetical protein N2152v2_000656 [Parachlorella kessleri]
MEASGSGRGPTELHQTDHSGAHTEEDATVFADDLRGIVSTAPAAPLQAADSGIGTSLLESSADPELHDNQGPTLVLLTTQDSQLDTAQELVQAGGQGGSSRPNPAQGAAISRAVRKLGPWPVSPQLLEAAVTHDELNHVQPSGVLARESQRPPQLQGFQFMLDILRPVQAQQPHRVRRLQSSQQAVAPPQQQPTPRQQVRQESPQESRIRGLQESYRVVLNRNLELQDQLAAKEQERKEANKRVLNHNRKLQNQLAAKEQERKEADKRRKTWKTVALTALATSAVLAVLAVWRGGHSVEKQR